MRRSRRGAISDEVVAQALALIERWGWRRGSKPSSSPASAVPAGRAAISVKALLCALLLLAADDRPLHLSGATEVLFVDFPRRPRRPWAWKVGSSTVARF